MSKIAAKNQAKLGATLVLISTIFYGSFGVWAHLLGGFFQSYTQAWIRCLLVILMFLPVAISQKQLTRIQWRRDMKWFISLLIAGALTAGPLFYAFVNLEIGLATTVFYAGFIVAMFGFGRIFSGEKLTHEKLASIAMAIIGLWLVYTPSFQTYSTAALIAALVSGLAAGLNVVTSQKLRYSTTQTGLLAWSAGFIVSLPIAFALHETVPPLSLDIHWLYLLIFAVVTFCASWLLYKGVKLIEAGIAGLIGLLEIVFGIIFGVILFHERPSPLTLVGAGVIIAAAAVPYIYEFQQKKKVRKAAAAKA